MNNKFNFLVINIKKYFNDANYSLDFNIFRKKTVSGLRMNFQSH